MAGAAGGNDVPYRTVYAGLRSRIRAGEFDAAGRLPAIRALADQEGVAPGTISKAVDLLADDGLVVRRHGSGIYLRKPPAPVPTLGEMAERLSRLEKEFADFRRGPATQPERQPVVAAIVTSGRAVLITARRDGSPPWAFVGGEINQGESPADAGIREVKEETGLEVVAGHEIGRRIHPRTGRTIVYMACHPASARQTEIHIGDRAELKAVSWSALEEVLRLMPDLYPPVRDYLERVTAG